MPRKINFADGFESSTEPVQGNITADNLSSYPDDASYEAVVQGSPDAGNIYYNTTIGKPRYYDSVASQWKDIDQDALTEIARLDLEQDVQDQDILQNASDIVALDTKVDTDNAAQDAIISQNTADLTEQTLNANQDRNLQIVGGGDITFDLSGAGGGTVVNTSNITQTTASAIGGNSEAGYTFTTGAAGLLSTVEQKFDNAFNITGIFQLDLYETDGFGLPTGPVVASSNSVDVSTFNPSGTETDVTFTFATQPPLLSATKYALVYNDAAQPFSGSIFSIKDGLQTYTNGEIVTYNTGTLTWEVSAETRDEYFVVNTVNNSTAGDVSWSAPLRVQVPGIVETLNTIDINSVNLAAAGEVAYIELNRDGLGASSRPVQIADISTLTLTDDLFIFARRVGDEVHFGNKDLVRLSSGQVKTLSANSGDNTSDRDKTLRLLSDGTVALTDNAGTYEAVNSDNIFVQSTGFADDRNTIAPQTISFPDNNSVAYVTLNRVADVATTLSVTVDDIDNLPIGPDILVIARRYNDKVFYGYPETIVLEVGNTTRLDARGSGGDLDIAHNLFRNSTFEVNQRGGSFSGIGLINLYTSDGWQTGGQVSSTEANGVGSSAPKAIRLTKGNTAAADNSLLHKIESRDFASSEVGDQISIKFLVNNETAGVNAKGYVQVFHANAVDNFVGATLETTYTDSTNMVVDTALGDYTTIHTTHTLTANDISNGIMVRVGAISDNNSDTYTINLKECHLYFGTNSQVIFQRKCDSLGAEFNEAKRFVQIYNNLVGSGFATNGSIFVGTRMDVIMRVNPTVNSYDFITQSIGGGLNAQIPGIYFQTPATFTTNLVSVSSSAFYIEINGYTSITTGSNYMVPLIQNNGRGILFTAEM